MFQNICTWLYLLSLSSIKLFSRKNFLLLLLHRLKSISFHLHSLTPWLMLHHTWCSSPSRISNIIFRCSYKNQFIQFLRQLANSEAYICLSVEDERWDQAWIFETDKAHKPQPQVPQYLPYRWDRPLIFKTELSSRLVPSSPSQALSLKSMLYWHRAWARAWAELWFVSPLPQWNLNLSLDSLVIYQRSYFDR